MAKKHLRFLSEEAERLAQENRMKRWQIVHRSYIIWFYVTQVLSAIVCMVGGLTNAWFVFSKDEDRTTVYANLVVYKQVWSMSMERIFVKTKFCNSWDGKCVVDVDQSYAFSDSAIFPPQLHESLEELNNGVTFAQAGFTLLFVFNFFSSMAMWCGYWCLHDRFPNVKALWYLTVSTVFMSVVGFLAGFAGICSFLSMSKSFRELLEDSDFVPDTTPKLEQWGWSTFVSFSGVFLSGFTMMTSWLDYRFVSVHVKGEPEIIKVRQARVKAWLNDVTNTSHISESNTVDTAAKALRSPGWTKEIHTQPCNLPLEKNWKDELVVEDLDQNPNDASVAKPPKHQANYVAQTVHSPMPNCGFLEAALSRNTTQKQFSGVDEEGNPLVFEERKRQVTRAPRPERPHQMKNAAKKKYAFSQPD